MLEWANKLNNNLHREKGNCFFSQQVMPINKFNFNIKIIIIFFSRERVYRFRCIVPYPPNSEFELELKVGDIIYVHKKRDDGWYKGTQQRTGRTGLFPASFVEAF